jgi:hypothetical protein
MCLKIILKWGLGIGDWGLGIGDWAQSPIPNPQIPNPQLNVNQFMNFSYQIKSNFSYYILIIKI